MGVMNCPPLCESNAVLTMGAVSRLLYMHVHAHLLLHEQSNKAYKSTSGAAGEAALAASFLLWDTRRPPGAGTTRASPPKPPADEDNLDVPVLDVPDTPSSPAGGDPSLTLAVADGDGDGIGADDLEFRREVLLGVLDAGLEWELPIAVPCCLLRNWPRSRPEAPLRQRGPSELFLCE
eukprot:1159735-Pelagomonas_calceolata.AAC.8